MAVLEGDLPDDVENHQPEASAREEFRRHFPVLLTAALGCALGIAGLSVYSLPLFVPALKSEFGWSPASISTAVTFLTIGIVLSAGTAGRLCDRFGVRKVIPISITFYALALAWMSQIGPSIWTLYLGYFFLAVTGSATAYTCYSRAISMHFDKGRGLAIGIMMSGSGLAAAIAPILLPDVIDAWGWRKAWIAMGLTVLLVAPFALIFLKDEGRRASVRTQEVAGMSMRQVARTRQFWLMAVGITLVGSAIIGSHLNLVQVTEDFGGSAEFSVTMLSVYGFTIIAARFGTGFLLDRFPSHILAPSLLFIPPIGLVLTALIGLPMIPLLAVCLGVGSGSEGDMLGYITGRYFGLRSYSEIFGYLFTALALGLALGPIVIGRLAEETSTHTSLWVGAGLAAAGALCFAFLGKAQRDPDLDTAEQFDEHGRLPRRAEGKLV